MKMNFKSNYRSVKIMTTYLYQSAKYTNASHLINAAIANYCDLNRQVLKSEPHNENDSFFQQFVCLEAFFKGKLVLTKYSTI